jgi:peptidoglycan/LPS O-acetylase OafA/YrhL
MGRTVSARWALVILGVSAVIGLLAVMIYVATRNESWLWAAVPACLGSGFLLFVMARRWPRKPLPAA